jgi:hypothetical protein
MWNKITHHWRLEANEIALWLGTGSVFLGILTWFSPGLVELVIYRFGWKLWESGSVVWGLVSFVLGLLMLFVRPSKPKSVVMLAGVAFWTFVTVSFYLVSPWQPVIVLALTITNLIFSVIAYWRSWVWL